MTSWQIWGFSRRQTPPAGRTGEASPSELRGQINRPQLKGGLFGTLIHVARKQEVTMECGILRIKQITAGGISHVGGEEDRVHGNARNPDIAPERSHLNAEAGYRNGKTLYRAWQDKCNALGINVTKKGQIAMDQAVITASPDFFTRMGWDKDAARGWQRDDIPDGIINYFNDSLKWAEQYFGKENIISGTIHMDETTPHMHIDYIPAVAASKRRKDVYARDEDGNLIRDGKGHAVRARDEDGKVIYDYVDAPARLSRNDFWQQRGGRQSYRKMQDDFFHTVSSKYGLERGEVGTGREHIEQERYKAVESSKAVQETAEKINTLRDIQKTLKKGNVQLAERIVSRCRVVDIVR